MGVICKKRFKCLDHFEWKFSQKPACRSNPHSLVQWSISLSPGLSSAFRSGTDLVSLVILFLFLLGGALFEKKPKAPSFQIGSGWKLVGLFFFDWRSRIFYLDVTLSRLPSWRHFTKQSAATWWENTESAVAAPIYTAESVSSWFIVHSHLFSNIRVCLLPVTYWLFAPFHVQRSYLNNLD